VASATNGVADTAANAAAFPAVASVLPTAAVMVDAGKIPVVLSAVSSAADPLVDEMAIFAVALGLPTVVVGGDVGNIPLMALAVMTSVVEGGAIPAVASAIPTAAVGGGHGEDSRDGFGSTKLCLGCSIYCSTEFFLDRSTELCLGCSMEFITQRSYALVGISLGSLNGVMCELLS